MKKIIRFFCLIVVVLCFCGCSWELPQSVAIKTNATYNFGIGSVKKDFSEFFSSDSILDGSFSAGESSKIYDYYPNKMNGQVQKYLMKIPLQEIAVNFTDYFNATNLAEAITDLSFSKTITVPELKLSMDEEISTQALQAAINASITASGTASDLVFTGDFNSVEYSSGDFIVTIGGKTVEGNVELYKDDILLTSSRVVFGKAVLSLSGVTLYKTGMTIKLPTDTESYSIAIDLNSKINKITSFTSTSPIVVPVTAPITSGNKSSEFSDCVIGEGQMDTTIIIPSSWSNVGVAYDVALSGGITASANKVSGNAQTLKLDNASISSAATTFSSNLELTFANSTITFEDSPKVNATTTVSSYLQIGLVLNDINTSIAQLENISPEMKNIVERLILTPSGLKGSFKNTLPEGNDISLSANSLFVGLDQCSQVLASNTTEEAPVSILSKEAEHVVKFRDSPAAADEYDKMDFSVDILLPGATPSNPKKIVVSKVNPNSSYEISISLEPDINWEEIVLYSSGVEQADCRSTGLNVSQMFTAFTSAMGGDFEGKVSIRSLPISIFAVKPQMESFEKAKFTGELEMFFGTESSGSLVKKEEYGTLTFMENGEMSFTDMPELKTEEKTIISDLNFFEASASEDLAEITNSASNDTDGSIYVRYKLKFTNSTHNEDTFSVTWDEYKASGSTTSSIAILAFIEIPLEFNLSDDINIDLLSMAGQTGKTDLLQRESPPTEKQKIDFLDAVRSIKVKYKSTTLPFYGIPSASLILDLDGPENSLFEKQTLDMEGGAFSLYDYNEILNIYPLVPVAEVILHKGTFSVPRKVGLEAQISLAIEMDPNYEIVVYGGAE